MKKTKYQVAEDAKRKLIASGNRASDEFKTVWHEQAQKLQQKQDNMTDEEANTEVDVCC